MQPVPMVYILGGGVLNVGGDEINKASVELTLPFPKNVRNMCFLIWEELSASSKPTRICTALFE